MSRVKEGIRSGIEGQSTTKLAWIECPEKVKVEPRATFECRAGVDGGAVTIAARLDGYGNVRWNQVQQIIDMRNLESTIAQGLRDHATIEAEVTCPGRSRPSIPGTKLECQVKAKKPPLAFAVPITIKNEAGQIDWTVPASILRPKP